MPEEITLINAMLGLSPYALIEVNADPESEAGFNLNVRAGGGVDSRDDLTSLLLIAIEELTGVPTDLYVQQVDVARAAAGSEPLSQSAPDLQERT